MRSFGPLIALGFLATQVTASRRQFGVRHVKVARTYSDSNSGGGSSYGSASSDSGSYGSSSGGYGYGASSSGGSGYGSSSSEAQSGGGYDSSSGSGYGSSSGQYGYGSSSDGYSSGKSGKQGSGGDGYGSGGYESSSSSEVATSGSAGMGMENTSTSMVMAHETSASVAMAHETSSSVAMAMSAESTTMAHEMSTSMSAAEKKMHATTTMAEYSTTTMAPEAYATSTAAAAAATYGSGSSGSSSSYDNCVQMCMAGYMGGMGGKMGTGGKMGETASQAASSTSAPPPASSALASNGTALVAGPGQMVVAPIKGDLRFVPFAVYVKQRQNLTFVWGAGPHNVQQSSQLEICNTTKEAGAFAASGPQNAGFQMPITVAQDTAPTFVYCSVPTHCQKGMFSIINPLSTTVAENSFGAHMDKMAASDSTFATLMNQTATMTSGNTAVSNWGASYDMSQIPEWAQQYALTQTLLTRQFYAANPNVMLSSASTVNTASSGASNFAPTSAAATAAAAQQTSGASFRFLPTGTALGVALVVMTTLF